nr:hypothetical protein BaRGS_004122 [Batillaria attramentaria]
MVMLENKRAYKFYNVLIINMAVSDLLNVSVKDPLTAPSRFSKRTALYIVAFSWAHSVLWTSLPLFGFSKYILEPYQTECSIDWMGNTPQELGYLFTTVVLYFAVPVVLALLFYTLVMKESKISGRSRHRPSIACLGAGLGQLISGQCRVELDGTGLG